MKRATAITRSPEHPAVSGKVGNVRFDGAHTFQTAHCTASVQRDGEHYCAVVELEADQQGQGSISLRFEPYFAAERRYSIDLNLNEVEPLAVALSRVVANAKARGFLPAPASRS